MRSASVNSARRTFALRRVSGLAFTTLPLRLAPKRARSTSPSLRLVEAKNNRRFFASPTHVGEVDRDVFVARRRGSQLQAREVKSRVRRARSVRLLPVPPVGIARERLAVHRTAPRALAPHPDRGLDGVER